MGARHMEFNDRHLSVFASPRDIERLEMEFRDHDIVAISTFTSLFSSDKAANRRIFEVAKQLQLEFIACAPDPELLPGLVELSEEYELPLAIHNSDAEGPYGTLEKVLAILERHPQIRTVADIGYYAMSGVDPVDALRALRNRVVEIHAKDLIDIHVPEDDDPYTTIGTGVVDWPAIAEALKEMGFAGYVTVEYTGSFYDFLEREPKIAASFKYLQELIEEE